MKFGEFARKRLQIMAFVAATMTVLGVPTTGFAQDAATSPANAAVTVDEAPVADVAEADGADGAEVTESAPAFDYYGPEMIKGQPEAGALGFQDQYTDDGDYALWMHDAILLPLITIISLFVLALLLWVVVRYNKRSNTVPSRTSHNTLIEVIWTIVPVLILLAIAVPSITLLANQYKTAPEDAITIKANGYQWYWGYEYIDNGGFEVISNMKDEADALAEGLPPQLAVDNRMVVPVGVPLRIQTFGKDVIHSFGIPSLWFKIDAVPGRINERLLTIDEPGIYYGQCMELCGARHGYMPIAIEARPLAEYNAWVQSQPGGMTRAQIKAQAAADAAAATPAADVSLEDPASDEEGAPDAGAAPTQDTAPTA